MTQNNKRIDPYSKVPLYHQLYSIVRNDIIESRWKPGELIPTESDFISEYGVSRTTVRQVLDLLVNEGFINRQRGRGSFVAERRLEEQLTRIINFTQDMKQRGYKPGTKVIEAGFRQASQSTADLLNIEVDGELVCVIRVRSADGKPICIEESYLVSQYVPKILDTHDFGKESLSEVLAKEYNLSWSRATQTIRATSASAKIAKLLRVKTGEAILIIERVSYSQANIPTEFLRVYYHPRYTLYNDLQG
jgi:GntR family transcriptional regulator